MNTYLLYVCTSIQTLNSEYESFTMLDATTVDANARAQNGKEGGGGGVLICCLP